MDAKVGEVDNMRITVIVLLLFYLFCNAGWAKQYTLLSPLEADSVLVAWLIKRHVEPAAQFAILSKQKAGPDSSAINTPHSPLRRSARFTAFDAAVRLYDVNNSCVATIQPLVRILEMTPWRKAEYPEALRFEQGLFSLLPDNPTGDDLEKAIAFVDSFCTPYEPARSEVAATDDLAFLTLLEGEWKVAVHSQGKYKIIDSQLEPHTFTYDFARQHLIYVAADKSVRSLMAGEEQILLKAGHHSYTQPSFFSGGDRVALVRLIDGSSTNTEVIQLNLQSNAVTTLVSQHSTQLDPFPGEDDHIFYATVSCVEGCGAILQEIWQKNIISGQARQLTLLNGLSHQPSVDPRRQWLYFSSNTQGHYHIWRMSLVTGQYEQLTVGEVTDSFPGLSREGNLYFLRTKKRETALMKIDDQQRVLPIDLPEQYMKIRELRMRR